MRPRPRAPSSPAALTRRPADYRTHVSGVRPQDLRHAKSFKFIQKEVAALIKDRIVVGHAVHNDFKVRRPRRPGAPPPLTRPHRRSCCRTRAH